MQTIHPIDRFTDVKGIDVEKKDEEKAIKEFNLILKHLDFEIQHSDLNDVREENKDGNFGTLSSATINFLNKPLIPNIKCFTLYFPISRYNEMDYEDKTFVIHSGVTPLIIMSAITTFYKQELSDEQIQKYVELDELYSDLLDIKNKEGKVLLRDAMFGLVFVEELISNGAGYIISLGS